MKKTITEKVEDLRNTLNIINEREQNILDLNLIYDESSKGFAIVDGNEEFYYDGYAFDRIYEELSNLVKKAFGKNCYLECECPGKWIICD